MIYKTIDLCAGIGGIRRGFELTQMFKNVLSAEIDPAAIRTYIGLFGDNPQNDLTSEAFKQLVDTTEYDVLLAGFPCQSFSSIGKKEGFRDTTRGTIFFEIADIISRTKPRAIFLENVENLISHDHGRTIQRIIQTLEEELQYRIIGVSLNEDGNYVFERSDLIRNSKDFGVPQNRPRVYLMAFNKQLYGNAIKLLNMQMPTSGRKTIFEDVNAILDPVVDDFYYMSQGYLNTLKKHKLRNQKKGNGFGYCVVNQKPEKHPIANTILATGGSGRERNLVYQPKEGVAGKILPGRKSPINSEGIRKMTPTEWGRLQGFIGYGFLDEDGNEKFRFPEDTTIEQQYKQLGNSVSIPVIEAMAEFMLQCFELLQKEQIEIILTMAKNRDYFVKRDVMEALDIKADEAGSLLKGLVDDKQLIRVPKGKTTIYARFQEAADLPPYSQEEKVVYLVRKQGFVRNKDVADYLKVLPGTANVLLWSLAKKGILMREKRGLYRLP